MFLFINEGEDLSDLAVEYSICPSKEEGGMLGWVRKGQMVSMQVSALLFLKTLEALSSLYDLANECISLVLVVLGITPSYLYLCLKHITEKCLLESFVVV